MKDFEPRPFQKEVIDKILKSGAPLPRYFYPHRPTHIGIDMAAPGSKDSSVIAYAKRGSNGKMMIWFDEYADFVMPKWYRHPLQWWKFRRLFRDMKNKVRKAGG